MTFLLLMKIKKNILSKFWNIRIFCLSNKFMHLFYVMKVLGYFDMGKLNSFKPCCRTFENRC